ncbi:hypothetical protein [Bradyrhizobium sp. USDA 4545]|uniref:hypothetical protein n=1 Tax=Bradyrhizobium sp. USDA 4545 TaxID=2817705 RepID=UPI0020A604B1|nr:hypothetical protein [Bradyrhizobium sp. USDA 4545]MCP1832786.1 hypothetical protein [Bradyrhizobium sp. USDA 4545]
MTQPRPQLTLKTCWQAPGYRSPRFVLVDEAGREYDWQLTPQVLQRVINECADAAKQIGPPRGPIDWAEYPAQVYWPQITPWAPGPRGERTDGDS